MRGRARLPGGSAEALLAGKRTRADDGNRTRILSLGNGFPYRSLRLIGPG
jgi:hypothetical protein